MLLTLGVSSAGFTQVGPGARTLGPEFNVYNADYIPEEDPSIASLTSEMSVEEAVAVLQRELVGAQFFGLDGMVAEHWGASVDERRGAPQAAAASTLTVDPESLTWRTMHQNQEEFVESFAFEDAVQLWTRFSMAERDDSTDPPTDSPQGVVLYLLTEAGADDVFQDPIAYTKILPRYPSRLPTYQAKGRARTLQEPGLFSEAGKPGGFAICCFSSTGMSDDGAEAHLPLERLPVVIAALERLSPRMEVRDHGGLLLSIPLADPDEEEVEAILAFCNRDGIHNQRVPLCQYSQLQGLAYMKHNETAFPTLAYECAKEWPGDYRGQGECVDYSMMEHTIQQNPEGD